MCVCVCLHEIVGCGGGVEGRGKRRRVRPGPVRRRRAERTRTEEMATASAGAADALANLASCVETLSARAVAAELDRIRSRLVYEATRDGRWTAGDGDDRREPERARATAAASR